MNNSKIKYSEIEDTDIAHTIVKDDLDSINNNMKKSSVCTIIINDECLITPTNIVRINSKEHPFIFLEKSIILNDGLYINPQFYENNRHYCDEQISKIIRSYPGNNLELRLDSDIDFIMSPNILKAIIDNPTIKNVSLNYIKLTPDIYNVLKSKEGICISSTNIDPSLKDIFDGTIKENMERELVDNLSDENYAEQAKFGNKATFLTYEKLIDRKCLIIEKRISRQEIEYVKKYAKSLVEVLFSEDSIDCIKEVIEILNRDDINYTIKIKSENYDFDDLKEMESFYPNLIIMYHGARIPLKQCIKVKFRLDNMLSSIEGLELSPLEKYLYIFNYVSQFRKYSENANDLSQSRVIYSVLAEGNESIVCVGFSELLLELCKRANIPCERLKMSVYQDTTLAEREDSKNFIKKYVNRMVQNKNMDIDGVNIPNLIYLTIDTSFSSNFSKEHLSFLINNLIEKEADENEISNQIDKFLDSIEITHGWHQRNYIYIKDEKYNIDGIYITDPTWNNDLNNEIYTTALMTPLETINHKHLTFFGNSDLFTAQSYEEFIEIIFQDFKNSKYDKYEHLIQTLNSLIPDFNIWHQFFQNETNLHIRKIQILQIIRNYFLVIIT
jgi:hypothetical protein